METIRIDPKTSKHSSFNYSFVHCVPGNMYTVRHYQIKKKGKNRFPTVCDSTLNSKKVWIIVFYLGLVLLWPLEQNILGTDLVVSGDCNYQLRVALAVVGMRGRDDGSDGEDV